MSTHTRSIATRLATIAMAFALATAASLAAIPSAALAASPPSTTAYVTRGQYVEQLLQATGTQPTTTTTQQDFSDVPPSSPYFGWVEAAYKAGITEGVTAPASGKIGVFGVGQDLTRAEAAAFDLRAYDSGVATYAEDPNTWVGSAGYHWNPNMPAYHGTVSFSDYASIPTVLEGDVYVASSIGLLHGFPSGTFGPEKNLTAAETAHLIAQLKAVEATAGAYHWRWIASGSGTRAEAAASNAIAFFAGMVRGLPYAEVEQYVEPIDRAAMQPQYTQMVAEAARYFNGGIHGTTGAELKVVGGAFGYGEATSDGGWTGAVSTDVEMVSDATGQPSDVYSNSPYFSLATAVTVGSDGQVVSFANTVVNADLISTVSPGETVAGVAMFFLGGNGNVRPHSDNAAAVVSGLGLADTAQQ